MDNLRNAISFAYYKFKRFELRSVGNVITHVCKLLIKEEGPPIIGNGRSRVTIYPQRTRKHHAEECDKAVLSEPLPNNPQPRPQAPTTKGRTRNNSGDLDLFPEGD